MSNANDLPRLRDFFTDATERAFTEAREAVRGCPTFKALCAGDQARIANILFSPFPPWEK